MAEKPIVIGEWATEKGFQELGEIFAAISEAAAQIANRIRFAALAGAYGAAGATNVQGEQQQKLDVFANEVMTEALGRCPSVLGLVSEEEEEPVLFPGRAADGSHSRFVLSFDPLDGSSNIDVNVNVGTIFGLRAVQGSADLQTTVLRPGTEQVAAGYVVYGPSVVFVATLGERVSAFTLNAAGEFELSTEKLQMPEQGPYYSANEANASSWPTAYRDYLAALLRGELGGSAYSARYIGSLVADFHRTLVKGGIFLYPETQKTPKGKLRLQYEANPLAMIAEVAGGSATNGEQRILDLTASGVHDRTPFAVGSRREVDLLRRFVREAHL